MSEPHPHDKANLPHYLDVMTRAEAEHQWQLDEMMGWFHEWEPVGESWIEAPPPGILDALLGACVRWLKSNAPKPGENKICVRNTIAGVHVGVGTCMHDGVNDMDYYSASGRGPTPLAACIAAMESILKEKE